jgi:hypothetical protein
VKCPCPEGWWDKMKKMKILEGFKDRPFSYAKKNNPIITKLFSSQGKKQSFTTSRLRKKP